MQIKKKRQIEITKQQRENSNNGGFGQSFKSKNHAATVI